MAELNRPPELDIEDADQLRAYLVRRGLLDAAEAAKIVRLAGGVSSRTMLVERGNGESWVIKQALAALRVHVEWLSSPERSAREAEGAKALASILPEGAVPKVVFEDRDRHLFAMEAVPKTSANWKSLLLAGAVDAKHFELAARLLAAIRRESVARQDEFAHTFSDTSFFESLRLEPYYEYTAGRVPQAAAFLKALCAATRSRRLSLVHGDFSPKNLLIDGGRMVLLDHEVIHFGDAAFDIGFAMAHFLSKAHHLSASRAKLLEGVDVFWRTYTQSVALCPAFEPQAARHALGCLLARVAGRSQLEYLSGDERLAQLTACIRLMKQPPNSIPALVHRFMEAIG